MDEGEKDGGTRGVDMHSSNRDQKDRQRHRCQRLLSQHIVCFPAYAQARSVHQVSHPHCTVSARRFRRFQKFIMNLHKQHQYLLSCIRTQTRVPSDSIFQWRELLLRSGKGQWKSLRQVTVVLACTND